jgi:predicted O-methyltransferase YrrM
MYMINYLRLEDMARECVNAVWGMGHEEFKGNSEIWAPYPRFLYMFAKHYKPELAIECGVYMATATEHMALANPDGLVIGIDRKFHPAAFNVVRRQHNVRFINGDTVESFDSVELFAGARPLELLFLDSTHDGDTPRREFEVYQPLMGEQCLVACDDILENDAMKDWWNSIEYWKMELNDLHISAYSDGPEVGFGIFLYTR